MLTLNQLTLYYWTLSGSTQSIKIPKYDIDGCAATTSTLPDDNMPPSQASGKTIRNHKNTHSHGSFTPSLTSGTSCLTTSSALTNTIKITSHPRLALVKVKVEPASNAIEVYSNGDLSDCDEMKGPEQEVAVSSPPKGKKHIMSNVSLAMFFTLLKLISL